ncbi:aldose epimerase family protein [Mucilaginibacter sp. UR6-11]|uniref:aldose epimerase family protein n=1 Tax=Mucilaginibacter sp. UR6-11 TaxID=1435644 RepID=UPI001E45E280|nr:aldose epimerase family protein [Mucilaginibacter sp. UR6-11]MCC8424750.1 galactose mutarotase [Mucilaginibacter sp. UR6-11]
MSTTITRKAWGTAHGEDVFLFTLRNSAGAFVEITNYGATLVSVNVPDRNSTPGNVIIGFPDLDGYLHDTCYIGSTIGRYANRISNAGFDLNGRTYELEANDGVNTNHGGASDFNSKIFGFEINDEELVMVLHSNDGDGGFPGNLSLRVTYTWSDLNALNIHYKAVSDKDTFANFTNHAYFNLSNGGLDILDHQLEINAGKIVDAGDDYIPTGKIIPAAVLFDNTRLGDKIAIKAGRPKGINAYYILNNNAPFAAKLTHPTSGRTLTVTTSYPGMFCYTGDYLNSQYLNTNSRTCQPFEGLCLECQYYPDSMNRPEFPLALLPKHHVYDEFINLKFGLMSVK